MMRTSIIRGLVVTGLGLSNAWAQEAEETPPPPEPVDPAEALKPLEAAYQKEVAYLLAEKEGLERRIREQARTAEQQRTAAQAELDRLDARMTALQVQSERAEEILSDVDRRAQTAMEAGDALNAAWFQARTSLEDPALPTLDAESPMADFGDAFTRGFAAGIARIDVSGAIRTRDGAFFDAGGTEREGTVVEVGQIATFGVVGDEAHALLPVGEDRLQAWREGGGATGLALTSGRTEPTMSLWLHEGRKGRIEDKPPKGFDHVVEAGGTVGVVIMGLGLIAAVLIVLRAVLLVTLSRGEAKVDAAVQAVLRGEVAEAQSAVADPNSAPTRVVAALLPAIGRPRGAMEDVANEAILQEMPRIERFETTILVAAAIAPLLGLLGTVTGMIATFDIITEFGTGDPKMLSGGISEALVTTQLGLIVAIPSLLGGNILSGWGQSITAATENAALRVLNALATEDAPTTETAPAARKSA